MALDTYLPVNPVHESMFGLELTVQLRARVEFHVTVVTPPDETIDGCTEMSVVKSPFSAGFGCCGEQLGNVPVVPTGQVFLTQFGGVPVNPEGHSSCTHTLADGIGG
tara:strand:+ start:82 stop:402 length:321 start_codon:yes stop_codon:yes gene_type:complete